MSSSQNKKNGILYQFLGFDDEKHAYDVLIFLFGSCFKHVFLLIGNLFPSGPRMNSFSDPVNILLYVHITFFPGFEIPLVSILKSDHYL